MADYDWTPTTIQGVPRYNGWRLRLPCGHHVLTEAPPDDLAGWRCAADWHVLSGSCAEQALRCFPTREAQIAALPPEQRACTEKTDDEVQAVMTANYRRGVQ